MASCPMRWYVQCRRIRAACPQHIVCAICVHSAMISVRPTQTEEERQICFKIRFEVFVVGQDVPKDEEMDEFDDAVQHYIAFVGDEPVGTGRLRPIDDNFIKFERVCARCIAIDVGLPVLPHSCPTAAPRLPAPVSCSCIWHGCRQPIGHEVY